MTSTSPSPSSSPSSTPPPPVANSPPSPDASLPQPPDVPPPESPGSPPQSSSAAAPPPTLPVTTPPSPSPITVTPPDASILSPSPSNDSPPPETIPSPPPQPLSPSPPPPDIISPPPVSASPPPPHPNPPQIPPTNQDITPPPSASITPPFSTSPPPLPSPSNSSTPNLQLPPLPSRNPTSRATDNTTSARQNDTFGVSRSGSKTRGVVAISLVVGFVTISLFLMAVWFKRRHKRRNNRPYVNHIMPSPSASSQQSDSQFLWSQPSTHPFAGNPLSTNSMYSPDHGGVGIARGCFTYEELAEATDGFSGSNLLGEGGFGCVYKGSLADGREVAVKQLKIGGGQGEREFRAEVEIISRVHHRHLVSLVGYCISEHQRLLVYQYVSNNTLHYHLHGEGRPVMDWATRIRVATGAARGLAYLHEDCHPRIIHRDIKSSNILLDDNFDAKVADFGLAKLAMDSNTHVTTRVMGTFGYVAPEYASSGKLTEKSDVFSFGVVLLELVTGRKPVDASQPLGDESLVGWARPLINRAVENKDFEELVDPRLGKNYVRVEMLRMIGAAAACVRHLAPKRPLMSQVVRALELITECTTDLSNGMKPGESEIVDSREQSARIRLFQRMVFGGQNCSSEFLSDSD